jgi:hypothetical protein
MSELEGSIEGAADRLYGEALRQFFPEESMSQEEPTQGCG